MPTYQAPLDDIRFLLHDVHDIGQLAALPGDIAALEEEQSALTARMSEADFYREDAETIRNSQQRIETIEALLMEKLERWETLEALSSGATTAARNPRPDFS